MEKPIIFDTTDGQQLRINMISPWLKNHYEELGLDAPAKIVKLSLDGGFTCPNRDGSKGTGGCLYPICDPGHFLHVSERGRLRKVIFPCAFYSVADRQEILKDMYDILDKIKQSGDIKKIDPGDYGKLAEEIRFSDPVSAEGVLSIENEITEAAGSLQKALADKDTAKLAELALQIKNKLQARNRLVKQSK